MSAISLMLTALVICFDTINDREYPGREGAPCNVVSPQDSANYLQLLKELRAALDLEFPSKHKLITAAVRVQPFDNGNGSPMSNVAAYVPYFDFICKCLAAYSICDMAYRAIHWGND
jgi:GH18 family chitinase